MTTKNKSTRKAQDPNKIQNYYGVFNHMIEDNITYLSRGNSFKSRAIGWAVYFIIISFLVYIFFTV